MPGVPKPYCQPCKHKRVRCDQAWPTCSACSRANIMCPGPSFALKFVAHNVRQAASTKPRDMASSSNDNSNHGPRDRARVSAASGANGRVLVARPRAARGVVPVGGRGSSLRSFRLVVSPQVSLLSVSDQVASRLVATIEGPGAIRTTAMICLPSIPVRLSQSECLLDSANYWCSSWSDCKQGLRMPSVDTMNTYGKALQSLRLALNGPGALSPETLAAATMIHQTGEAFFLNKTWSAWKAHSDGVAQLLIRKGLPNLGDKLDVTATLTNQSLMAGYELQFPGETPFSSAPWKEALEQMRRISLADEGLGQDGLWVPMTELLEHCFYKRVEWATVIKSAHADPIPYTDRSKEISTHMWQALDEFEAGLPEYWAYIRKNVGDFGEVADADFFLGKKYWMVPGPKSRVVAEYIFNILYMQLMVSRMLYDLGVLYGESWLDAIKSKHRELSAQAWMLIPHMMQINPFELQQFMPIYYLSFEGADEIEQKNILDAAEHIDKPMRRFGQNRDELQCGLLSNAKFMTGKP